MAGGGAERAALELATGLAERGLDVDLVLASAEGPRMADIPDAVRVVDLKARRMLTGMPALVRYLRREQPVGIASVLNHANIALLWARRLARHPARVVVIEQNTRSVAAANGKSRRDRWMPRLASRFYPWADCVAGVSAGVADDLVRLTGLDPAKVRVIYNPIVSDELVRRARAPLAHPWLGDGNSTFVAVGRLRPQKDFPMLLRAFETVRAQRPARLIILGEGNERAALERLAKELGIEDDVQLPGEIANPYAYMARAAAFVLSSRWEGLPTVLIEALRCGAPVIATDCPSGPREILKGGRFGVLLPVGDAEALAGAMIDCLDGKLAPASDESWQPYHRDRVVDDYLEVLLAPGGLDRVPTAAA